MKLTKIQAKKDKHTPCVVAQVLASVESISLMCADMHRIAPPFKNRNSRSDHAGSRFDHKYDSQCFPCS
jgi:hypothetical protein